MKVTQSMREKICEQGAIGFGVTCDWKTKLLEFVKPIFTYLCKLLFQVKTSLKGILDGFVINNTELGEGKDR